MPWLVKAVRARMEGGISGAVAARRLLENGSTTGAWVQGLMAAALLPLGQGPAKRKMVLVGSDTDGAALAHPVAAASLMIPIHKATLRVRLALLLSLIENITKEVGKITSS